MFVSLQLGKCLDMMIGMGPLVCMLVDCRLGQGQETWSTSLADMGGNNKIFCIEICARKCSSIECSYAPVNVLVDFQSFRTLYLVLKVLCFMIFISILIIFCCFAYT